MATAAKIHQLAATLMAGLSPLGFVAVTKSVEKKFYFVSKVITTKRVHLQELPLPADTQES